MSHYVRECKSANAKIITGMRDKLQVQSDWAQYLLKPEDRVLLVELISHMNRVIGAYKQ